VVKAPGQTQLSDKILIVNPLDHQPPSAHAVRIDLHLRADGLNLNGREMGVK
jgi:hypothetical protein